MSESSAVWRSRDHRRADNLSLDTLENMEVGWYRSGQWLGPPRRLNVNGRRDPDAIAELAARCRVQAERMAE